MQGPPDERPPGFSDGFWAQVETTRAHFPLWGDQPDEELCQAIRYIFEDFFKLRDNVYDGPRIASLVSGHTPETLLEALAQVELAQPDKDYRLGGAWLGDALATVQEASHRRGRADDIEGALSTAARGLLDALVSAGERGVPLNKATEGTWTELREKQPRLYAAIRTVLCISADYAVSRNQKQ